LLTEPAMTHLSVAVDPLAPGPQHCTGAFSSSTGYMFHFCSIVKR
jgi:hypothetical protein